jgi:hypothetical protein
MLYILLSAHVTFVLILWLVLGVVSALITTGIGVFGYVPESIWDYVATQVPRWFLLGIGGDAISTYLRLHLANGRTRGDFLRQLWPYFVGLAVVAAALQTVGYLIEGGVYAAAGWPHRPQSAVLFSSSDDFVGIFATHTLFLLLWTMVGALISVAFIKGPLTGLLTLPLAVLVVAPGESLLGANGFLGIGNILSEVGVSTAAGAVWGVAAAAACCAAIWGIARDIPLRPKVA